MGGKKWLQQENFGPHFSNGMGFSILQGGLKRSPVPFPKHFYKNTFKKGAYAMRIQRKKDTGKRYLPGFSKQVSSLLVFLFLIAAISGLGASDFLSPATAEAQGSEKGFLHRIPTGQPLGIWEIL